MSAQPVNVLAVMLADALAAEDWRVLKTGDRNAASARKFSDEARAAVAELVEASHALGPLISEALAQSKHGAMRDDAIRRRDNFYAALARVQGGAK